MKRRTRAYVAGPYRAPTEIGIHANIAYADAVGRKLLSMGYTPIVPHKLFAGWGGGAPDEVFLEEGLRLLEDCDCVIVLPRSDGSSGTKAEVERAKERGIPVLRWTEEQTLEGLA